MRRYSGPASAPAAPSSDLTRQWRSPPASVSHDAALGYVNRPQSSLPWHIAHCKASDGLRCAMQESLARSDNEYALGQLPHMRQLVAMTQSVSDPQRASWPEASGSAEVQAVSAKARSTRAESLRFSISDYEQYLRQRFCAKVCRLLVWLTYQASAAKPSAARFRLLQAGVSHARLCAARWHQPRRSRRTARVRLAAKRKLQVSECVGQQPGSIRTSGRPGWSRKSLATGRVRLG